MTTKNAIMPDWEALRTDESREVERFLSEHFDTVSAYRYNSASLRVRVIDPRFRGMTHEQRDDLVEPQLAKLDQDTQADIMNLYLLYPAEADESSRAYLSNFEFEHPSESML